MASPTPEHRGGGGLGCLSSVLSSSPASRRQVTRTSTEGERIVQTGRERGGIFLQRWHREKSRTEARCTTIATAATTVDNTTSDGRRGVAGEHTHLLLALAICPLTTHPFRDGTPLLLLIETPPTFGRSLRCFHVLHGKFLLILSPSCFAVCAHHLSPRVAIVLSLLSSVPYFSM